MAKNLQGRAIEVKNYGQLDRIKDGTWIRVGNKRYSEFKCKAEEIDPTITPGRIQTIREVKNGIKMKFYSRNPDDDVERLYKHGTEEYYKCKEDMAKHPLK